ncbi:trichohyalin-like [Elysia marginata]|uniref:Trichohyalin-like n=1 Tax=Elysia marginata TaxID=1093978 RepID=A0AAV4I4H5_9GAST|nr:trichohyalin-like [Elysia marginata]
MDSAAKLSPEARHTKTQTLRRQRQAYIALNNWDANQALLAEATALYTQEQHTFVEGRSSGVGGATVASIVLADLQQRQEIQANQILLESVKQNQQQLTKAVLAQIETRQDQLFPNIAFVVLGELEVSAEDQDFVVALEAKFKAMRDQMFVFALIEKLGSGWKRFEIEEESLLSWLMLPEVKALTSRVKYVQLSRLAAEKYVANAEASYETCLLAVGLLERITQPR